MTTLNASSDSLTDVDPERAAFEQSWREWYRGHQQVLADPHGFLAITSLHWLQSSPQRFDDAPGEWSTGPDGVRVVLADGEHLKLNGVTLSGEHNFGTIAERASLYPVAADAVIEVAKRGGHDIIRPRHPDNPLRVRFVDTPAYQPDPRWVITGRYRAFDEPRPTTVGAAVEGLQHVYDAPGQIEFTLEGRALTLTAFNGHQPGALSVLFTDATSGVTTYAANRALNIDPPDADGLVRLDFNRASNLPCAYTDLATCPLPPAANRLPIAVEAGEQIPYERR